MCITLSKSDKMVEPSPEIRESYEQEVVTQELLSQDWPDIYAVLAEMYSRVTRNRGEEHEFLKTNVKFARALYQAQKMLGIAVPINEVPRPIQPQDVVARVRGMTREEFDRLSPADQKDVSNVRLSLGLSARP